MFYGTGGIKVDFMPVKISKLLWTQLWMAIWLQISMVKYFHDFCEFYYDHEIFCYNIFLTAVIVQDLTLQNHTKV